MGPGPPLATWSGPVVRVRPRWTRSPRVSPAARTPPGTHRLPTVELRIRLRPPVGRRSAPRRSRTCPGTSGPGQALRPLPSPLGPVGRAQQHRVRARGAGCSDGRSREARRETPATALPARDRAGRRPTPGRSNARRNAVPASPKRWSRRSLERQRTRTRGRSAHRAAGFRASLGGGPSRVQQRPGGSAPSHRPPQASESAVSGWRVEITM